MVRLTLPLSAVVLLLPFSSPASAQTQTQIYSVLVSCTSSGEMCSPAYSITVTLPVASLVTVGFTGASTLCSNVQLYISVDGVLQAISPFFGANQIIGPVSLGTLGAVTHSLELEGVGEVGGCNSGTLGGWGGTL